MTRSLPGLGIVCVPFNSVPSSDPGSIGLIVESAARALAGWFRVCVVGGDHRREPGREHRDVRYVALHSRRDRWLTGPWSALTDRVRGRSRHPFHRHDYGVHYVRAAARHLRKHGCDTVLVCVFPQWLPVLREELPGVRLVLWSQDVTFVENPDFDARCLETADLVVGCSRFVVERIASRLPSLRNRCHVVYNSFDPDVFSPSATVDRDGDTLLYVGRITPEKGVHHLVAAFRALASRLPHLRLELVGPVTRCDPRLLHGMPDDLLQEVARLSRDYRGQLQERAGPAAGRLVWTGSLAQRELPPVYRRATLLVQPSLWQEPFGLPALEAMACATPVVATRVGAHPEFIETGKTGVLVNAGSPDELDRALTRLLDDPQRRRDLGAQAATAVLERFPVTRRAASLAQLVR